MKRVGAAEIRKIDRSATQDYLIPGLLLMENAGRSVAEVIFRDFRPCKTLIFVGKGNNGGDGLVVARHLANRGYAVRIILLEDPVHFKPDPLLNFNIVAKMGIPWVLLPGLVLEDPFDDFCESTDLVVDAIFGVGIQRPVTGIWDETIRAINRIRKPTISVDVPSGLDADTGQVQGAAVRATRTVTLALPKLGLFEGEGPRYAGEIEVVDIGLPRELLEPYLNA